MQLVRIEEITRLILDELSLWLSSAEVAGP